MLSSSQRRTYQLDSADDLTKPQERQLDWSREPEYASARMVLTTANDPF